MEDNKWNDILRQKLADYEAPVDSDTWEAISRRLQEKKNRKAIVAWFTAGAAVAASVILLLVLQPASPGIYVSAYKPVTLQVPESLPANKLAAGIDEHAIKPSLAVIRYNDRKKTTADVVAVEEQPGQTGQVAVVENEPHEPALYAETIPVKVIGDSASKEMQIKQEEAQDLFNPFLSDEDVQKEGKKQRKKWAVALLAGQYGDISSDKSEGYSDALMANAPSAEFTEKYSLSAISNKDIGVPSETNYHTPLSFGLTFRYYFTPHWALESGLAYTYLATDYIYNDNSRTEQRLHYLGVPLNLVYQFIGTKYFSLYLSGGGMLEKGLKANYTDISSSQQEEHTSESISGLQWSLNSQLGVSYNFTKQFSLYAEPGVRWFAPSTNQPKSVRTERPWNFSLSFGLRTNF